MKHVGREIGFKRYTEATLTEEINMSSIKMGKDLLLERY